MEWDIALMVMTLVTVSVYMLLQTRIVSVILGVAVFSNAINLIILTSGDTHGGLQAPILSGGNTEALTDPLPQALILTAIVIGFGLLAFFIGLLYKIFMRYRTEDMEQIFKAGQEE